MKNIEYVVTGMRCAGCSGSVEKKVSQLEGVQDCNVNLLSGLCTVKTNDKFDENKGVNVINQLGFKAQLKNDSDLAYAKDFYYTMPELVVSLIFSIASILFSFASTYHWIPVSNPFLQAARSMVLSLPVVLIGLRFYIPGYKFLFKGYPNMDSLVSLGSSIAFVYSLILFIMALVTRNQSFLTNVIFQSATMIISLIYIGKYIEQSSQNNARDSISGLLDILPTDAIVLEGAQKDGSNGTEVEKCVNLIEVGDFVVVKAGERVPIDGVVVSGSATVDSSSITGESASKTLVAGNQVLGGYTVLNGKLIIKASKITGDASINTILRLVSESQNKKSTVTKIVDQISYYFVPVILGISLVTFVVWFLITKNFSFAINRFIATLVVACPCSIGLAIPLANVLASSLSLKKGFVYRNSDIHKTMAQITTAVFDKTGTITTGDFSIDKIELYDKQTKEEVLAIIAGLEAGSNHPIAKSLIKAAKDASITVSAMQNFKDFSSKGIAGTFANKKYYFGNNKLVADILKIEQESSPLYLFDETKILASVYLSDTQAPGVEELLSFLGEHNIHVIMLTGDNKKTADRIAHKLGINDVRSELMPNQKYEIIQDLKAAGKKVLFVGDGVNDAPSISESDIGVSPYGSTDIATDNSDVYLLNNNLGSLKMAYKLSTYTSKIILLNLFWAFAYNILGVFLASGIFSFAGIMLQPWMSAMIMAVSSICVVLTTLTLKLKFRTK